MTRQTIVALAMCVLLMGYAPIEHTQSIDRVIGQRMIAGPGELIVRVSKQRNLVNAFGRADFFGRRTDEGYAELRFAGIDTDGTVVFYRNEISILTNETTMSRTPNASTFSTSNTTANASIVGNSISGSATTTGTSTTIFPQSDYHVIIPIDSLELRLPQGTTSIPFEGYIVNIFAVEPLALTYQILPQPTQ